MSEARRPSPFDKVVEQGASMVSDGLISVGEIEADDELDATDEELQSAVQNRLSEIEDGTDDEDTKDTIEPTSVAEDIDWQALWDEFDLTGPLSRSQLLLAVAVSEQTRLSHNADTEDAAGGIIKQARKNGQIFPLRWHPNQTKALEFSLGGRDE